MSKKRKFGSNADGGTRVDDRTILVHRSRFEMLQFLNDHLKSFAKELLELLLDFMVNYRMLFIFEPSLHRFRAVSYNLFSDDGQLELLSDQIHSSKVSPMESGSGIMSRRVNRSSEIRGPLSSEKKKQNIQQRNADELRLINLNWSDPDDPHSKSYAVLRFSNFKMSLRSMNDLDESYPLNDRQKRAIAALSDAVNAMPLGGILPHKVLNSSTPRLLCVRNQRGIAVWDRVDHKMVYTDPNLKSLGHYSEYITSGPSAYVIQFSEHINILHQPVNKSEVNFIANKQWEVASIVNRQMSSFVIGLVSTVPSTDCRYENGQCRIIDRFKKHLRPLLIIIGYGRRRSSTEGGLTLYDLVTAQQIAEFDYAGAWLKFPTLTLAEKESLNRRGGWQHPFDTVMRTVDWPSTLLFVAFRPSIPRLRIVSFRWVEQNNSLLRISPLEWWIDLSPIIVAHYENQPLQSCESSRFRLFKVKSIRDDQFIHVRLVDVSPKHTTNLMYLDLAIDCQNKRVHILGDLGKYSISSFCETY